MRKSFILLILLLVFVSGCDTNTNNKDSDGYLIGISNQVDDTKLQIKVIIDKINIREDASASSKKIGIVIKDSVFDVLEYKADNDFIWFKILTNNNISGYIASDLEDNYVLCNGTIDYKVPEIEILNNIVNVTTRNDADTVIRNNVIYNDDQDEAPILKYVIEYENQTNPFSYPVNVTVTDASGNYSEVRFILNITGEKKMSDGNWLTYQEILNLQKKAKSLCSKYNLFVWDNAIGCTSQSINYDLSIASNGVTRIGLVDPFTHCDYDKDFNLDYCEDGNGNIISHDIISNNLKSLEDTWLPKFKNYRNDVINTTGYDLYELTW